MIKDDKNKIRRGLERPSLVSKKKAYKSTADNDDGK